MGIKLDLFYHIKYKNCTLFIDLMYIHLVVLLLNLLQLYCCMIWNQCLCLMWSPPHLVLFLGPGENRTKGGPKAVSCPLADLSFCLPVLFYTDGSSSIIISHHLSGARTELTRLKWKWTRTQTRTRGHETHPCMVM